MFGDWLVAAGDPARGAAVWRAVALSPLLAQSQRDELDARLRLVQQIAGAPSSLDEVMQLLASMPAPLLR